MKPSRIFHQDPDRFQSIYIIYIERERERTSSGNTDRVLKLLISLNERNMKCAYYRRS